MWAIGDSTTGRGQDMLRGRVFLDVINSAQCPAAMRHNLLAVKSMQHPAYLGRFSVSTHMSNVLKLAVQFFNEKRGGINVGEQLPLQMWSGRAQSQCNSARVGRG